MVPYFLPLGKVLAWWPSDLAVPADAQILDKCGIEDFTVEMTDGELRIAGTIVLVDTLSFSIPGFDSATLVLQSTAGATHIQFDATVSDDSYRVRLIDANVVLQCRSDLLKPVIPSDGGFRVDETKPQLEITIAATIGVSNDEGFYIESAPTVDFPPFTVGDTGLVVEATDVVFALREQDRALLPTTIPAGWRGIYLKTAQVHLPSGFSDVLPGDVQLDDFFVGSGGFGGRISGQWAPVLNDSGTGFLESPGAGTLFGVPFALKETLVEIQQNAIVSCSLKGTLILPFFDRPVDVDLALVDDGGLVARVVAAQGALVELTKDGVLRCSISTLVLSVHRGLLSVVLSGTVTPLFGGLAWPSFEVSQLGIDTNGKITIDGGWIDVGKQGTIEFNGAMIEISKLGFGTEDDGTKWIGFSGGLKLADPLPVSGSVEGLRINWRGSDIWLELRGAAVGFEVPQAVRFAGHLEFVEDPVEPRDPAVPKQRGFRGGGSLTILPTNMNVSAEVVVGKSSGPPAYPFAYLFVDFQTALGLPMGIPNVAIYGFSGLLGLSMEPKKDSNQRWWEDWYLLPPAGVSSSTKWRPAREAFALGTGVTLGTAADNGYAVHGRLLLALVLPGPTLLLEGVAGFLEDRTHLGEDSPIHALAVLDGKAGQFLMNVQARYPFSDSDPMKKLIQAHGGAEAFFDRGGDWHFFLGERDPRSKRVTAEILKLFEARSYLMLVPDRVGLGVWVGFDKRWKFGPLKVHLEAWLDANAGISWRPVQFAGDLTLVGDLGLKAFGIGASLSVHTDVSAQAPAPYKLHAEIKAQLHTPRFIPDPKCHITWDYEEPATPLILDPIGRLGVEHLKVSEKWSLDGADSEPHAPVVPLDSKVAISFERSVEDTPLIGGTTVSGVPPWERSGRHEFAYRLTEVQLERRAKGTAGGAWETVATRRSADDPQADLDRLWGAWLAVDGDSASGEPTPNAPMTKLLLHANSPFEYARENVDDSYFDHFAEWHPDYGWVRVTPPEPVCFGFEDLVREQPIPLNRIQRGGVLIFGGNLIVQPGQKLTTVSIPACVRIGYHVTEPTWIFFPEPVRVVTLTFVSAELTARTYNGPTLVSQTAIQTGLDSVTIGALDGPDWTSLSLEGGGCLGKICYVTAEEADRYQNEQTTGDGAAGADDHYDDPPGAGLLLPQSYYRITVGAEGRRRVRGESDVDVQQFQRVAYFQTADPPGVCDPPNAGGLAPDTQTQQYPAAGALKDLTPYVAATPEDDRAAPDDLLLTTPVDGALATYRSYDVGCTLNEVYVEQMYLSDGMPLVLSLYDTNGLLVGSKRLGDTTDAVPAVGSSWEEAEIQPGPRRAAAQQLSVAQIAKKQLGVSDVVSGADAANLSDAELMGLGTAIAYLPKFPDIDAGPPAPAMWTGGADFSLEPQTLYRATLEAVRPAAVAHLDPQGVPLKAADGSFLIERVAVDGSNLRQILEDPAGLAKAGPKVMTDGRSIITFVPPDTPQGQRPTFNAEALRRVFNQVAESLSPQPPTQVFYWNFTTSRFATFIHHAHSFVDVAWNRRASMDAPFVDLQPAQVAALRTLVEDAGAPESALYEQAASLFGLGSESLPDGVEVQVLADANHRYGFLILSPEPLDWQRTIGGNTTGRLTVAVTGSAATMLPGAPAFGAAKLIGCQLGVGGWVELLVREDMDLAGWVVGGPAVYHTFPSGPIVRAGTVLRLYAGDVPVGAALGESVAIANAGDAAVLDPGGVVLALEDPHGRVVHRRQFLTDASFDRAIDARLAADSDGTRTFVFLQDHGAYVDDVPDGSYRLAFTYRRSGAGQGRRLLRRNGSADSEVGKLEFAV